MAKYATFNYGECIVYGTGTFAISRVDVLAKDTVRLFFSEPVVVNDAYSNKDTYTVTRADGNGILNVRKALKLLDGSLTTTSVLLYIDQAEVGIDYVIEVVGALLTTSGGNSCIRLGEFTGKATKADSTLSVIPKHYDNKPGSIIRAFIQAVANQDDLIGGDF